MDRAKARLDFAMKGCKCRTGCGTRRCHCKQQGRTCGPACQCINYLNITDARTPEEDIHELEVQDLVDEQQQADEYVDLSEDELHPGGPDDEETDLICQTVFGEDSTC